MLAALPAEEAVAPLGPVLHRRPRLAGLRSLVSVVWKTDVGAEPATLRVLPDAAVDVIVTADRVSVAGPDTGPQVERVRSGPVVGFQLRPEAVSALLGVPASAVRDRRVDIAKIWGEAGQELNERRRAAANLRDAVDIVEGALLTRANSDLLVPQVAGLRELVASTGRLDAEELGVGERQLRRRCVTAFGYGPKVLARVLRFQRALDVLRASYPGSLSDLAAEVGYADQAHLARDVGEFSGLTPAGLRRAVTTIPSHQRKGTRHTGR